MAKIKKMNKEELEAINKIALEQIETMDVTIGRKSEKQDFLLEIKEVISKAIDKGIPFTQITKIIKELYSIDVSVNMLKTFAINHLDYKPKKRINKATASVEDKVSKKENTSGRINADINEL